MERPGERPMDRARQPPPFVAGGEGVRRLSLVRLSAEIARAATGVGRVAVEGEVVLPRRHPGGVYFTLRDRAVQVSVRCPTARRARCRAVAGERVLVTGTPAWLPERGQLQLVAEEVAPVGEGAIAAALAEVRARLAAEGLLVRPRRRIPRLPAVIGVVCGTDAAVRADIDSVVAERFPSYPVDYVATNVSGPGAAHALVAALAVLDARTDVEVVILARGGGDASQLLAFSDEELCRAIARCTTPVVSAIGHDGDRPLCDEVADLRCGTPSLAAAAVVPSRAALEAEAAGHLGNVRRLVEHRLGVSAARLAAVDRERALRTRLGMADARLGQAAARRGLVHPRRPLAAARSRLERADWSGPARRRLVQERERLGAGRRHLEALSPARVLGRGYAVVRAADGSVVRHAGEVVPGQAVAVQLATGRLGARVEETAW